MSDPYIGEIRLISFNFAPKYWALCNGQLLPINQNQALFSLLGTTYGGNGQTTFALPNLQSRLPIHFGIGPGLSPYVMGQVSGSTAITLNLTQIPSHSHVLNVTSAAASTTAIGSTVLPAAPTAANASLYAIPGSPALEPQTMASGTIGIGGGSQPHNNLMPSLTVNFAICLLGIFPSQN
jgi:microcystin-dependent protein